jgi:glycosyltransferase involved in cell wall biosynthesis
MNDVLFSVVMPAFNAASTVDESMNSVVRQTLADWELLVVDDCSQDTTRELIEARMRSDSRVRGFFLHKNGGVSAARNVAIREAKGRFLAFLDADDLWCPEKLQRQFDVLNTRSDVVFSDYIRFDAQGLKGRVRVPPRLTYGRLLNGNCIGNLTGAYNCERLGKYFQRPIKHEDYLMWLQILKAGTVAEGIGEVTALYRVTNASVSANKLKAAHWTWNIYRRELSLNIFNASYRYFRYFVSAVMKRV